jgi:hypothetical protein
MSGLNYVLTNSGKRVSLEAEGRAEHLTQEGPRRFSVLALATERAVGIDGSYQLPSGVPADPHMIMAKMAAHRPSVVGADAEETVKMMEKGRVFTGIIFFHQSVHCLAVLNDLMVYRLCIKCQR